MTGGGQDCQLALPHLVGFCPILNIHQVSRLAPDIRLVHSLKERKEIETCTRYPVSPNGERGRNRERKIKRQTERQRERDRQKGRERETDRKADRERLIVFYFVNMTGT